jgi:hypothetical protein
MTHQEPFEFTAGDTVTWSKTLETYPAPTWTLHYVLVNASQKIAIDSEPDGLDHKIALSASTTATYEAGTYGWQSYVTSGGDRHTLAKGSITIKPDFVTALATDTRTHVKRTLDHLEAMIEGKASKDIQEYSVQGRMMKHIPIPELIQLYEKYKNFYAQEVASEKASKGFAKSNKIFVRF